MGKKGGGRKAFVKAAMAHQEEPEEGAGPQAAMQDPLASGPESAASEGTTSQLKEIPATQVEKEVRSSKGKQVEDDSPSAVPEVEPSEGETRGQMVQRHKREMKAHKEYAKKLGKKNKDEAETLEKSMEERHKAELDAWDAADKLANPDKDVTLVAPTIGLYDMKLGTEESKKKPTKAQKRRGQKAAEEAEREARIAEEQANMGDSERQQEADRLARLLQPLGLAVRDIQADGHCMYRAVQDQLSVSSATPPDFLQLRSRTAEYMRAHADDFMPFVTQEAGDGEDPSQHFSKYCSEVESTAAWGGQVELQALAQALQRHIVVYSVGLPAVELGSEFKGKGDTLQVCYLRHAFGLGEHYNSVAPLEDEDSADDEEGL